MGPRPASTFRQILGVEHEMLLAMIVFVLCLVPTAGAIIACVIVTIVTLLQHDGGVLLALKTLAAFAIVIVMESTFLSPRILGQMMDLHPVLIIGVLPVAQYFFGIWGLILALLEFSATVGFTYNFENYDTDYTSGVDSHLDWAVSQFLNNHLQVGIAGYVYCQLTPDNYSTSGNSGQIRKQVLGDNESDVAAVGPEIGYVFNIGGKQAYANLRGYYEFWSQNRMEGFSAFLNVEIPL